MKKFGHILFYWPLLFTTTALTAQDKKMFIEQIAGKKIAGESINSDGKFLGKQEFIAEKISPTFLAPKEEFMIVPWVFDILNETGKK